MVDFAHGSASLRHRRIIGAGGYGVVHEVLSDYENMLTFVKLYDYSYWKNIPACTGKSLTVCKSFARKLLNLWFTPEEIENEERAIRKLCGNPRHRNIVQVLRLGKLSKFAKLFHRHGTL